MSGPAYDRMGIDYSAVRRADPRFEAAIWSALGDARTVLNVGAGAGSYEPRDREVTAVEPSPVMTAQRPPGAAPAIQGWRRTCRSPTTASTRRWGSSRCSTGTTSSAAWRRSSA